MELPTVMDLKATNDFCAAFFNLTAQAVRCLKSSQTFHRCNECRQVSMCLAQS